MPAGQFRGMTKRKEPIKVKGRLKEPKAKHAWSSSRKYQNNRFYLETVQPKKPTRKQLTQLRKTKNARVVKQKTPREGHRVNVRAGKVVGKYGIYTKPKMRRVRNRKRKRK